MRRPWQLASVAVALLILAGLLGHGASSITRAQDETEASPEANYPNTPLQSVSSPEWHFNVYQVADPYTGTLNFPRELPADTRVVGAEVEIANRSDQPLGFRVGNVIFRDIDGLSFRAGSVGGAETGLEGRNLAPGERARGWVWVAVPNDTQLLELVLLPDTLPEFTLSLEDIASPVAVEATPTDD